jgi:hypothetical protein
MSRHRDESYFRSYTQVVKMLFREVVRQTPEGMIQVKNDTRTLLRKFAIDHPTAEYLVLYVPRDRSSYLIVPVGPDEPLKNIAQAQRQNFGGKTAVAYSPPK